jgi:hypothetical protein
MKIVNLQNNFFMIKYYPHFTNNLNYESESNEIK